MPHQTVVHQQQPTAEPFYPPQQAGYTSQQSEYAPQHAGYAPAPASGSSHKLRKNRHSLPAGRQNIDQQPQVPFPGSYQGAPGSHNGHNGSQQQPFPVAQQQYAQQPLVQHVYPSRSSSRPRAYSQSVAQQPQVHHIYPSRSRSRAYSGPGQALGGVSQTPSVTFDPRVNGIPIAHSAPHLGDHQGTLAIPPRHGNFRTSRSRSRSHGQESHSRPRGILRNTPSGHHRSASDHLLNNGGHKMSGSSHGNQRNYSQDEHDRGRSLGPAYDQQRSLGGGDPKGLTTGITAIDKYLKLIPPAPDFCWSNCTGRKKAVCIGINYIGQRDELKGCVNDARHVRNYLMQYHGFKKSDILLLTDDGRGIEPTRKNMLDAMHWLVRKAKMHDSLVFHYSGHGGQKPDDTGKEADGMDEVIFPVDYKRAGDIIDDELYIQLVQPLAAGCRLTAVFDSCHSGTVLDLPYLHSAHGRLRGLKHISKRCQHRNAPHADVISLSACKDDETSADTFHGGVAVGAMSYALIKTLKENPKQTYDDLLAHLRHILVPKYNQKAQLGGSHPLDLNRQFIM